jgi:hypothetical protein
MANEFETSLPRVDNEELQKIKANFGPRDNIRADNYEINKYNREFPNIVTKGKFKDKADLTETTLFGLSYPLELDGKGGLKTASNYDRIGQQIIEILDTRVGERVYRRFFGIPELIFETISEDLLSQIIKKQISNSLPFDLEMDVSVELDESGTAVIFITYSPEGSEQYMIRYNTGNA